MRCAAPVLLTTFAWVLTAGCGGGGTLPSDAGSSVAPTARLAFGVPQAVAAPGLAVPIRVFNYSHLRIVDMGIRPLGSSGGYDGALAGHDPAQFARGANGGVHWVTVPAGAYEIYVETDRGRYEAVGATPVLELPDGTHAAGPADVYLFAADHDGRWPRQ